MRRIVRPLLVAALIVGPIAGLALTTGANEVRRAPPLPERVLVAPQATVASLEGRPAIIHFWASWCEPCKDEAPELARLAGRLGDEGTLVGVDWSDSRSRAEAFLRRHRWRFPVLEDSDGRAGDRHGVVGLPSTFILDSSGHIVRQLEGPQTSAGLLEQIRSLSATARGASPSG